MKDLLAADRTILILCPTLSTIPATIHQIESSKRDLYNDKIDSLITDQTQNSPTKVIMQGKVEIGYEQVEDDMKEDSSNDDEHGPISEGIWITHLRELVHDCPKGQAHED